MADGRTNEVPHSNSSFPTRPVVVAKVVAHLETAAAASL